MGTDHFGENKHVLPYFKGKAQIHSWGQGHALYSSQSMISLVIEANDAPPELCKVVVLPGASVSYTGSWKGSWSLCI